MKKRSIATLTVFLILAGTVSAFSQEYMIGVGGLFTDPLGLAYRFSTSDPFVGEEFLDASGNMINPFQDSFVRTWGDSVFVIGRFNNDTVTILRANTLRGDPVANYSVGIEDPAGNIDLTSPQGSSNPHDLAVINESIAYMAFYGSSDLLKLNPLTGERLKTIDISSLNDPSGDGLPEAEQLLLLGNKLYVMCQRLDRNEGFVTKGNKGAIGVIDTTTDALVGRIDLQGENPGSMTYYSLANQLLIPVTGNFAEPANAGLEVVDLTTETTQGIQRTVEQLGGKASEIVLDGSSGYILSFDDTQPFPFPYFVRTFDPATLDVGANDVFRINEFVEDMALDVGTHLYVLDRTEANPGVHVIDTATNTETSFVPTDLPLTSLAFARTNVAIGGSAAGPEVQTSINPKNVAAFTLLLSQQAIDGEGRIYVSLAFPSVFGLVDLLFFRPEDENVPTASGAYVVLAADGSGFLPGTEDNYFFMGTLSSTAPDLQFTVGGISSLRGQTGIFTTWYLEEGLDFNEDNLKRIQSVTVVFD
jgi:hypothetical protein